MNILAIGAHPADVFDLSGGTLANFASQGHGVYLSIVTHGAYSHSQLLTKKDQKQAVAEIIALKRKECEEASRHIGVKETRYLEFDDEPFIPSRKMVLVLGEYVREVCPDIVITHHPKEYGHPDHPVVGELALRSLKAAERWLEGSSRVPHPIKRVYFFGTQFRGICAKLGSGVVAADFVVDVGPSIEKKKKAIAAFQSQSFQGAQYEERWVAERLDRIEGHFGFTNGLKYAEEFISLTPQIVSLLPCN
ncbi:MAG: PIG-L family deacetylase [Acidobacteria bacterium]|nr:PIG-L family deacetylase [Acidobacteriota bacterium]